MEIFLAKLLGFYFIIIAIIILLRQRSIMTAVRDLVDSKGLLLLIGVIEIATGLSLAITYPTVSWSLVGIISLIGYILVIEGIIYLFAPSRAMHKFVKFFNTSMWYGIGGLLSIIIGIYLVGSGFGLF